jgi:hypothetical protein
MKRSFEERMSEFEISLLNEPVDLTAHFEVAPLTALERARALWRFAEVIEGEKGR